MRIAIFGDLHFGRGTKEFLDSQIKFLENFCDKIDENNINSIIFLGDIFHNRVSTDNFVMNKVLEVFSKLSSKIEDIKIICGNHDTYYKNTNDVNSLKILEPFADIIYSNIFRLGTDNLDLHLVPWQFDNSFSEYKVNSDKINYCFGHFDIAGCRMNKAKVSEHGFSMDAFKQFNITFSGHYHTKSEINLTKDSKIIYTGTPWQLDRGDIGDVRGYHIFDCSTQEIEFIENEDTIGFSEIYYPIEPEKSLIANKYVDVYFDSLVAEKDKEIYLKKINELEPAATPSVRVLNSFKNADTKEMECKNISDLIEEYVDIAITENKEDILDKLKDLYLQCQKN